MTPVIINVTERTIRPVSQTLARAFCHDPVYTYVFDSAEQYERIAPWMFETLIRWCMLYGKAWTTPYLDAVALRRLPNHYDITLWSLLRTGMFAMPWRLGKAAVERFNLIIELMSQQHTIIMGSAPHWYCWMIAVAPEQQGQGLGKVLMRHTFQYADQMQLPCYLETTTAENVQLHHKQGYILRNTLQVPASDLKLYAMVRPPHKLTKQT